MTDVEEKPREEMLPRETSASTRKAKESKPIPPEFAALINTPPDHWFPTHTIRGEQVMRVVHLATHTKNHWPMTRFWTQDRRQIFPKVGWGKQYDKPIPIVVNDIYGKPVDSIDAAYMRGYDAGKRDYSVEKAREHAAKFSNPLKEFRTRDLATVFMATMGAHEGDCLILSVDGSESEFKYRDEEGCYIVMGRIYDWRTRSHAIHKIRLPETMMFEVIE
jgi:hypothetical protein